MIAKVVFDLPIEGPFDYLIPPDLENVVVEGVRVKVPFGPRVAMGFVVALAAEASVPKIKVIKSLIDQKPIFDERDMMFARQFCGYYACSTGEALSLMTRHRQLPPLLSRTSQKPLTKLYHCLDGQYPVVLRDVCRPYERSFVLVPDAHMAKSLGVDIPIGLRSSMFEAFTQKQLIVVIDEDNASFKQEQSPMYESRQVLLMAQGVYGFDLVFISQTPSIELMHLADTKCIDYERHGQVLYKPMVIDLSNYKFLDKGILSVPVRNVLEYNIKAKLQTLVFFNRRGTFSVTRCSQCGYILKCRRCDSAVSFERGTHSFVCRQCQERVNDPGDCPVCMVPAWKSFGMGIEKVQKEIADLFPMARIASFEGADEKLPAHWDVLIATAAILRFQHTLRVATIAIIDIDSALNRLDIRSSFKTWSLLGHAASMAKGMLVQTRNLEHPMIKAFGAQDDKKFYTEEANTRQELELSPFYHWVAVVFRGKKEKNAQNLAREVYNHLKQEELDVKITEIQPDVPAKLRDQHRFRLMAGGRDVSKIVAGIKRSIALSKRISGVIITFNIDP